MLMRVITQRRLAELAGLTQSAVSLALRGHASIPAATRQRVEHLAAAHGYCRDPLVTSLALRRWATPLGGLAYLGCEVAGGDPANDNYWRAVRARCRELGLEVRLVPPARRSESTLGAEMAKAGVRGLVVGQITHERGPWRVDWAPFAVVHCGLYAVPECGDVVAADLFAAVARAWRELQSRGYRRVAVVVPARPWAMSEQILAAAVLALAQSIGDPRRFAVWVGSGNQHARMHAWLRRRRPQAVLGYGDGMREELQRVGIDLPFASLACTEQRLSAAGMVVPYSAIGTQAVDLLVEKIRHGSVDRIAGRRIHLIEMPWRDGDSLPGRVASAGANIPA